MVILGWTLIVIVMGGFFGIMATIDIPDEEIDKYVNMIMREVRIRWYFSKLKRELKRA